MLTKEIFKVSTVSPRSVGFKVREQKIEHYFLICKQKYLLQVTENKLTFFGLDTAACSVHRQ